MKKISLLFFLFLILNSPSYGNWYGDTWELKNINGGMTNCSTDGDTTGGSPSFYNAISGTYYYYDSRQINESGIWMYCQKWDGGAPVGNINYFNGWTNNNSQSINFTYSDAGGSGFNSYTVQYRTSSDTPNFLSWSGWSDLSGCVNRNSGNTCVMNGLLHHTAYQYRIIVSDNVGNIAIVNSSNVLKIDMVAPSVSDISVFPANGTNLLAVTNQNFQVFVGVSNGSPISSISTYMKNPDTASSYNPSSFDLYSSSSSPLSFNASTQFVDNNKQVNGGKLYYLLVSQACDEAGNCLNNTWPTAGYTYNIYSNSTLLNISTTNSATNASNVADGGIIPLNISMEDIYGNDIVPASGINRTIDFTYGYVNTLYLDQYNRTGVSGVYSNTPSNGNFTNTNFPITSNTNSFTNQPSTNGNYPFQFRVYSPTSNSLSSPNTIDPNASFSVSSITANIGGTIGTNTNVPIISSPIDFRFKPLFTTSITGEVRDNDFYEGRIQNSSLQITRDGGLPTGITNPEVKVEFGTGARLPASGLRMQYGIMTPPTGVMSNGNSGNINTTTTLTNITNTATQITPFYTKLVRLGGSIVSQLQLYLSSHITYLMPNPDTLVGGNIRVAYNGDIVNKANYFDNIITSSGSTQQGVKVTGISTSKNSTAITNGQFATDIQILGKLDKSNVKKDIVSNVYRTIKTVSLKQPNGNSTNDGGSTPNGKKEITTLTAIENNDDGAKSLKNTLLYFGNLDGDYVELTDGTPATPMKVSGKKTLVIIGGDLLISENMYYETGNDILGIIVLKDSNGKGGNIYIDPNVTNIVGTMIVDKVILSGRKISPSGPTNASNIEIIDENTPNSFDVLKNQLHIFGSVLSENTLGGSRITDAGGTLTPKCPYFVKKTDCTLGVSERYDLNFIRRYNLIDRGVNIGLPSGNGKVSGGGVCSKTLGVVSCTNPYSNQLKRTLTTTTDSYAKYSTILEYNATISKYTPPLFGK